MSNSEQITLVGSKLCPFVQRVAITLLHKEIDHTVEYIELNKKPDWFNLASPLGKVPLLKVGDEIIFESAVICQYLDEVYGDSLLPSDPLLKAHHRAWFEFSSSLNNAQHQLTQARREQTFRQIQSDLAKKLAHLEAELVKSDGFARRDFSLLDAAFAPFLVRSQILADETGEDSLEDFKNLSQWRERLLMLDVVKNSVTDDFEELFLEAFYERDGYLVDLSS